MSELEREYIWKTIDEITENTLGLLSKKRVIRAIKKLQELGFLEVVQIKKKGNAKVNGYKLRIEVINERLRNLDSPPVPNGTGLPVPNGTGKTSHQSQMELAPVPNGTGKNEESLDTQGLEGFINNNNKNNKNGITEGANAPSQGGNSSSLEKNGKEKKIGDRKKEKDEEFEFWRHFIARVANSQPIF